MIEEYTMNLAKTDSKKAAWQSDLVHIICIIGYLSITAEEIADNKSFDWWGRVNVGSDKK